MKNIIEKALLGSFAYEEYKALVTKLIEEGRSTGNNQSEALLHYSQLNETRIKRLDKTIVVEESIASDLKQLKKEFIWLVISEGWCGDAAQLLPIMNKMAELSNAIDLRIVLRDANKDLMDLFLTNGSQSIPKLIILDANTKEVVADWGPRPEPARKLIADYKAQYGVVDEPIKIDLQKWYLQDKGLTTQEELMQLLRNHIINANKKNQEILH
ncbi:thioredoxin family protein [Flavobacterium jejuense]|uniref:Thioredoxin family protein n=1 Tax=Flavobacterium jejuense TaxID=1544455 RepID=A0ABX0IT89_9FLAO|nr:thioredoxin family protein [Flavobacterium jejuense]NHN27002.1 thioredoxin family protein [Flavobacterium jejuense]